MSESKGMNRGQDVKKRRTDACIKKITELYSYASNLHEQINFLGNIMEPSLFSYSA